MRLVVFSHKQCWLSADAASGYASDGGFPFQMRALSELFDQTTLVVPCSEPLSHAGEIPLEGHNLSISPLTTPKGTGLARKLGLGYWLLRNGHVVCGELLKADAVHAPIPGDIGTLGMLLALVLRKPLFVRHCGNWFKPVTPAEHFWKWFMEKFAGGNRVMLATGGAKDSPSLKNDAIRWIFSTTMSEEELRLSRVSRDLNCGRVKLIIVCRQDREKGTGVVIESLPSILRSFPNASLDVVGDGVATEEFRTLAATLGLTDRVFFHGKVDHAGVVSRLRQADLFCYPTSASEGFPKVVLEALACGLPVVTTRVSVLPELIGAGGGILIDERSPAVMSDAVVEILSDRGRYRAMSLLAMETASCYSIELWRDTIGEQLNLAWGDLSRNRWEMLRAAG